MRTPVVLGCPCRRHERLQVRGPDSDRCGDPDVRQFADRAEAVHGRGANAELVSDLRHPQQPATTAVKEAEVVRGGRGRALRRGAHVVPTRVDLRGLHARPRPGLAFMSARSSPVRCSGSAAVTLADGLLGYRASRKRILLGASALIVLMGLGFAGCTTFWPITADASF